MRDPVQASGPVVVKLVIFAEVPQLRVPVPIALTLLTLPELIVFALTTFPVITPVALRPPKVPFPTQFNVDPVVTAPVLFKVPDVVRLVALMTPAVIIPVHPRVPELRMLVVLSVLRFIVIHGTVEIIFE